MPCTTILVGKKASLDGSTLIARNDDGYFDVKKLVVVSPKEQPRKYKSKISHVEVELPTDPMSYTATPNVDLKDGIWAACGINAANVAMTATETITTNPRVLGADPLVRYKKAEKRGEKDIPGGIGEEDLVVLVLPYIRSAREGVLRTGALLEQYGTYESNGIAFSDSDSVWWMETIGGHHWIARRVADDECVIMPNQFGLDRFDMEDALNEGKENLCSADLKTFVEENHLDPKPDAPFCPRIVFGSRMDSDHLYNTPRAWFMGRYFLPTTYNWDGPNADFTPESDNIPWSFVPEKKVSVEDVKYCLSSYYQGTPYNPYSAAAEKKGIYRAISCPRTGTMAILQIRGDKPEKLQAVEWICFGSTAFDTVLPVYTHTDRMPAYLSKVTTDASTDNFYWCSRLINVLTDAAYSACVGKVESYQDTVPAEGRRIMKAYDAEGEDADVDKANEEICAMAKKETQVLLNMLILETGKRMKNAYDRAMY